MKKLETNDLNQVIGGLTSMVAGARCLPNAKGEASDIDLGDDPSAALIPFPSIYGF